MTLFAHFNLSYAEAAHVERLLHEYIKAHTDHELCDVCKADLLIGQSHATDCPVQVSENIINRIAQVGGDRV